MTNEFYLLTLQEAMNFLQVSRSTIDRWRKTKQLPFIKIGKEIFFHKEDIEMWLRSQTTINETSQDVHSNNDSTEEIITIGYQSKTAHMWSPVIMKELRLFEEELLQLYPSRHIKIQWVNAENGLELVEGLVSGKIHIASLGDYPIIMCHHLSLIFPNFNPILIGFDGKTPRSKGISLVIPRDMQLRDLEELDGSTISTVLNSSAGHRLNQLLSKTGIKACEIIDQNMTSSFANIINRSTGASVMWEPYVSLSESRGATRVPFEEGFADDYLTGLVAQDRWSQLNEDILIAYLKAHIRTHQFCREYPLKVAKMISRSIGIDVEISEKILSNVRWDAAVYHRDLQTLENLSAHRAIDSFQGAAPLKSVIPYRGYYLDEAAKRLHLARLFERPLEGEWQAGLVY